MFNAESAVNVESYFHGDEDEQGLLGCLFHEAGMLETDVQRVKMLAAMDREYAKVRNAIDTYAQAFVNAAEAAALQLEIANRHGGIPMGTDEQRHLDEMELRAGTQ